MKTKDIIKFLGKYLKNQKKKIIVASILLVLSGFTAVTYGYLNGRIVENVTKLAFKTAIFELLILFTINIINNLILNKYDRILMNKVGLNLFEEIGYKLYEKVGLLPARAFEEKSSGEFINRITNDAEVIGSSLNNLLEIIISILISIFVFLYILWNSWIIALIIIGYLIIIFIYTKWKMPKIKTIQKEIKKEEDNLIANVNEAVRGTREIKALGIRKRMNHQINKNVLSTFSKRKDVTQKEIEYQSSLDGIDTTLETITFIVCIILLMQGKVSMTFFIAMTYFIYRFMYVIQKIGDFSATYQRMKIAVERISEILENKLYLDEQYGTISKKKVDGLIEFREVHFHYYDSETKILNGFNLTVRPNSKIAIIGKSGQGKTTIFNLLLRYFDATDGEILIDGINIKDLDEESLRNNISIIRQDPFLFNKTIFENFQIIDEKISLDDVREVCQKSLMDDYIMSLPDKYDTKIGEGGVKLSGGQKQRLAIARSLIKKSKIILFDEATSALDNESQDKIIETIEELSKDHTIIIIAHRLSTIVNADCIYFMESGKIIERGTHQELLKNSQRYQNLYQKQKN